MCGIVGYIGKGNALPFLIQGLSKLEYRGYDSSGVALYNNGRIEVTKKQTKTYVPKTSKYNNEPSDGEDDGKTRYIPSLKWLLIIKNINKRLELIKM